jgi:thioester reductase-like protein
VSPAGADGAPELTLVTGFPGFIGRRLVAHLLGGDAQARVVALVEERMLDGAQRAAEQIDAQRIELVSGDITRSDLGLDEQTGERLRAQVRRVFHLAAIYNLSVPLEVAQRVNVEGTGNVLDFCRAAERLERLAYVSTAYVAGLRRGTVYEHELSLGQGFKNHYESTKFQAEVWVRELMDRVPTTILRPAIVVGDSRTGETDKFDGPYYVLRGISQASAMGRPLPQFGHASAPFNVVPVDYVVEAMAAAATDPAAEGETLHLVDPEPPSARDLVELLARLYGGPGIRGRVPSSLVAQSLKIKALRERMSGTPPESIAYLNHPVVYDTRRAVAVLSPHGLRPPRFPDYAPAMVDYFRAHEHEQRLVPPPAS